LSNEPVILVPIGGIEVTIADLQRSLDRLDAMLPREGPGAKTEDGNAADRFHIRRIEAVRRSVNLRWPQADRKSESSVSHNTMSHEHCRRIRCAGCEMIHNSDC